MNLTKVLSSTSDTSALSEGSTAVNSRNSDVLGSVMEPPEHFSRDNSHGHCHRKIQKMVNQRVSARLGQYIHERMNAHRLKLALYSTYKLTFQRLMPEMTPYKNHTIAIAQDILREPADRGSLDRFLASPEDLAEQAVRIRKGLYMSLAALLRLLEAVLTYREKLNWLFMYVFDESDFNFAVASELHEVLNKTFAIEKTLEQIGKLPDEAARASRLEEFKQYLLSTVNGEVRTHFGAKDECASQLLLNEFEIRKIF